MARSVVSPSAVTMFSGGSKAKPKKAVKKAAKKVGAKTVAKKAAPKKAAPRTGKANPALFSSGIDPKVVAKLEKQKKEDAKRQQDLTKAGFPQISLARFFPTVTPAGKGNTRKDGSFVFPKPWEK